MVLASWMRWLSLQKIQIEFGLCGALYSLGDAHRGSRCLNGFCNVVEWLVQERYLWSIVCLHPAVVRNSVSALTIVKHLQCSSGIQSSKFIAGQHCCCL